MEVTPKLRKRLLMQNGIFVVLLVALGDGAWARPANGMPSTHILKVEPRRYPGMAELESACLRLARAVGLTSVESTTATIGDLPLIPSSLLSCQ